MLIIFPYNRPKSRSGLRNWFKGSGTNKNQTMHGALLVSLETNTREKNKYIWMKSHLFRNGPRLSGVAPPQAELPAKQHVSNLWIHTEWVQWQSTYQYHTYHPAACDPTKQSCGCMWCRVEWRPERLYSNGVWENNTMQSLLPYEHDETQYVLA